MLFSIPESGWWLIAVATTVFFMVSLRVMHIGVKLPDDQRTALERQLVHGWWKLYLFTPVLAVALLGTILFRPEPAPTLLFAVMTTRYDMGI